MSVSNISTAIENLSRKTEVASQPWRKKLKLESKKSESANQRQKVRTDEGEDSRLLREGSQWTPGTKYGHPIQVQNAVG